jgi:hypothetical protein
VGEINLGGRTINLKSYYYAEKLANRLNGRTCFISRKHSYVQLTRDFYTLHSLTYKVLRKSNSFSPKSLNQRLSGELMFQNVKISLEKTFNRKVSKKEVRYYYYKLRKHQNYGQNLNTVNRGLSLLKNYQEINDGLDWEESMQLATWYLEQDVVRTLYKFNYKNIKYHLGATRTVERGTK